MKKIGERIRTFRSIKNLSQANVAEELGMTPGAYAKIERGETDTSVSRLFQLAEIFGIHVKDFFEEQFAVTQVNDAKGVYGYASKHDVEQLSKSIQSLLQEIQKIKTELRVPKTEKKKRVKK